MDLSLNDTVTPHLVNLEKGLSSRESRTILAAAAADLTRDHLTALAAARHRPHVPHNFYANAARSTTWQATDTDALVIIDNAGIAQRYYGGILKPRRTKHLAIPADKSAEGRRPREFNDLFYLHIRRTGTKALARKTGTGIQFLYWLVTSVTQAPDPSVMPTDAQYAATLTTALSDYLEAKQ